MTLKEAKSAIQFFTKTWRVDGKNNMLWVADKLGAKNGNQDAGEQNFEFSLVEGAKSIKMLHLLFWREETAFYKKDAILKKRERSIFSVFQKTEKWSGLPYDKKTLHGLFSFNRKFGPWPIQCAVEKMRGKPMKIKVYLSVNGEEFPLKRFCRVFGLSSASALAAVFKNKNFDTVAADFLPSGDVAFKFYPLHAAHRGYLCRVDESSRVDCSKKWRRFPGGILMPDFKKLEFMKISPKIRAFILKNNFKIHYLCSEAGKKSIYFR